MTTILDARKQARDALESARSFIANGVDLGFIRMPDADCPDTAHLTPLEIEKAITALNTAIEQMESVEPVAFEDWWQKEGQFCRAGGGDYEKTFAYRAWESAAQTHPAAPAPDATKWQLVPVEPTEEMQEAMLKANIYPPHQPDGSVSVKAQNLHIYKAMLSAAPKMSEDV